MSPAALFGYAVGAAAVAALLLLRLRRMTRPRPLKLGRLWIGPAILLVLTAAFLVEAPPPPGGWPWLVPAAVIGAALGWARGRLMTITVHPETHALDVRASRAAVLLVLALVGLRLALRSALMTSAGPALGVAAWTDALLVFATMLVGAQRLEMGLRGRRLLAQARAASAVA